MKTGTITFHATNNNGSFLQAYALQSVLLDKLHIENKIIDFHTQQQVRQYSIFRKMNSVGDIGRNFISLVHYHDLNVRYQRFDIIRKKYLKLSEKCSTPEEVYKLASLYDVIICGSDQIWNTEARDFSDTYFMLGIEKRKIAYAPSFGSHIENIDEKKVRKCLTNFCSISVREDAGKVLLNKIMPDWNVETVCDPTLLLGKNQYERLIKVPEKIKEPYIFLYTINYSGNALKIAKKLSKYLKIPVYAPFTGYSCVKCRWYGIQTLYDIGPAEFLWLVEHATYTCSNSFHGIAFSIIFQKQFCRPVELDRNGKMLLDDRIDSLLEKLNLHHRIVSEVEMSVDVIQEPINYDQVKEKLHEMQKAGIRYLTKALLR